MQIKVSVKEYTSKEHSVKSESFGSDSSGRLIVFSSSLSLNVPVKISPLYFI